MNSMKGAVVRSGEGAGEEMEVYAFSDDEQYFVFGGSLGSVKIWKVSDLISNEHIHS